MMMYLIINLIHVYNFVNELRRLLFIHEAGTSRQFNSKHYFNFFFFTSTYILTLFASSFSCLYFPVLLLLLFILLLSHEAIFSITLMSMIMLFLLKVLNSSSFVIILIFQKFIFTNEKNELRKLKRKKKILSFYSFMCEIIKIKY
jgi:hypothetical protein